MTGSMAAVKCSNIKSAPENQACIYSSHQQLPRKQRVEARRDRALGDVKTIVEGAMKSGQQQPKKKDTAPGVNSSSNGQHHHHNHHHKRRRNLRVNGGGNNRRAGSREGSVDGDADSKTRKRKRKVNDKVNWLAVKEGLFESKAETTDPTSTKEDDESSDEEVVVDGEKADQHTAKVGQEVEVKSNADVASTTAVEIPSTKDKLGEAAAQSVELQSEETNKGSEPKKAKEPETTTEITKVQEHIEPTDNKTSQEHIEAAEHKKSTEHTKEAKACATSNLEKGPPTAVTSRAQDVKDAPPRHLWLRKDHSREETTDSWLTKEIEDFIAYISPSEAEIRKRNEVVRRVADTIRELWPEAQVRLFGSFASGIYLPNADLDLVVLSKLGYQYNHEYRIRELASVLQQKNITKQMKVIANTRVPIIKFEDRETGLPVDISFEKPSGVKAVKRIRDWCAEFPQLRPLVLVVKQFLVHRNSDEVYKGGLGSFSVVCMAVSFLNARRRRRRKQAAAQQAPREDSESETAVPVPVPEPEPEPESLGKLVLAFFELYGVRFNYARHALRMTGDMAYLELARHGHLQRASCLQYGWMFGLAIEDPEDPANNIAAGSFRFHVVKDQFQAAFERLAGRCRALEASSARRRQCILDCLFNVRYVLRDFRDGSGQVQSIYHELEQEASSFQKKQ